VGVTLLPHRPAGSAKGHFMLLLSPRAQLPKDHIQPRDLVLVLDVSGSMAGNSIIQAKKALRFLLDRLGPKDRFGLITFSDTANQYGPGLWEGTADNVGRAKHWVHGIEAVGGTNINDALLTALDLRQTDAGRTFTVIFFTDGLPTIGVTDPAQIVKNVLAKNTASTRIFTFGVGHEVNATLLDQIALQTRAASAYVRPTEDIEAKVGSLHAKINHPVLVNLKLSVGKEVVLEDMQPPKLPDLFHGGQVMVLGKYTGHGRVKLTLEARWAKKRRSMTTLWTSRKSPPAIATWWRPFGLAARSASCSIRSAPAANRKSWSNRSYHWQKSMASPRRTPAIWSCRNRRCPWLASGSRWVGTQGTQRLFRSPRGTRELVARYERVFQ
jgi:Ca-activated chloride channel family protein